MLIRITAADIRHGDRSACWSCPVARALKRADGSSWHVCDGRARRDGEGKGYCLPDAVRAWICEFDRTGEGSPIEFELPVRKRRAA